MSTSETRHASDPPRNVVTDTAQDTPPAGRRGNLGGLLSLLAVGNIAMYMVYMGVGQVLLPLQVEAIDPADKVANFGLVSGISAIFATLFNPLAGVLSDRSRRRNP